MFYTDKEPLFIDYIRGNDAICMESFMTLRAHQKSIERMQYFNIVNEAAANPNGRAALIQKLYESILKHKNFDTTIIANSKGVFTKFEYYDTMMDSIDTLNKLYTKAPKEIDQMNSIVEILEKYRPDFVYGYKADIDFIKMYYEMLIVGLFQLIDFGICAYVETIKPDALSKKIASKAKVKYASIINNLLNTFKKGDWGKLVSAAKKSKSKGVQESLSEYEKYNEMDIGIEFGIASAVSTISTVGKAVGTAVTSLWPASGSAVAGITAAATPLGILSGVVVVGFLSFVLAWAALHAIRLAVCWFYTARFSISDHLNRQVELLRYNTAANDPKKEKKEHKAAQLQAVADFIAVKTKTIAENAEAEEEQDDKENFSTSAITTGTQDMADVAVEF